MRYRFELRNGDSHPFAGDIGEGRNRAELVAPAYPFGDGEEIWWSWAFRILDSVAFASDSGFCYFGQWHVADPDGPSASIITVECTTSLLIRTRSDDARNESGNGVPVTRWTDDLPTVGAWHNFVLNATLGETGSLYVWRDGVQIIDESSVPIGHWSSAPLPLCYFQFGIYATDRAQTIAVEYANVEWGGDDLTNRIANPLPIA